MNISIHLKDRVITKEVCSLSEPIKQRFNGGAKGTKISIINANTGETLDELHNKVVITGSQFTAMKMFGIENPTVDFKTYNMEMDLDNDRPHGTKPKNEPIICLFCVSDSGCGTTTKDVYVANFTDRIKPAPDNPSSRTDFKSDMIMPFRFVDKDKDLSPDLRKYYFGRKTFDALGKIGYYFKTFDTEPQLHLRYSDGTQITEDIYDNESDQLAECYVEMRLRITRLDLRDYFENILGWDKARISSLSLCYAWYDDTIDNYKYFQDIYPYSFLPFSYKDLVDANVALDFLYQIYY